MKGLIKNVLAALGLLGIARRILAANKRKIRRAVNLRFQFKNWLRGGNQANFFEELMDQRAAHGGIFGKPPEAVTGWPDQPRRQFAAKFLQGKGWLTPSKTFLDYGCGNAATGVHFIRVLEPGHYTGADLSSGALGRAREWVDKLGLVDKKPNFVHLAGGSLAPLEGRKFDVIFSQDVVIHMAPELVVNLVRAAPGLLNPNGAFFIAYTHSENDMDEVGDQMNWFHNARFFEKAAAGTPLVCEEVREWSGIEYKNQPLSRMVRLSLKAG